MERAQRSTTRDLWRRISRRSHTDPEPASAAPASGPPPAVLVSGLDEPGTVGPRPTDGPSGAPGNDRTRSTGPRRPGRDPGLVALTRELAQLEVALLEALILRDIDALGTRLGDEFTLTTARDGAVVASRAECLRAARDEYALQSFGIKEVAVQPYGDVAVVRVRSQRAWRWHGADRVSTYWTTDVFVRRDDDWQLVTRHETQVADD